MRTRTWEWPMAKRFRRSLPRNSHTLPSSHVPIYSNTSLSFSLTRLFWSPTALSHSGKFKNFISRSFRCICSVAEKRKGRKWEDIYIYIYNFILFYFYQEYEFRLTLAQLCLTELFRFTYNWLYLCLNIFLLLVWVLRKLNPPFNSD
jgi:hypothetical protein